MPGWPTKVIIDEFSGSVLTGFPGSDPLQEPVIVYTNQPTIAIVGLVEPGASVDVTGGATALGVVASADSGAYEVLVDLLLNQLNTLRVTQTDLAANQSTPITLLVVHDNIPPLAPGAPITTTDPMATDLVNGDFEAALQQGVAPGWIAANAQTRVVQQGETFALSDTASIRFISGDQALLIQQEGVSLGNFRSAKPFILGDPTLRWNQLSELDVPLELRVLDATGTTLQSISVPGTPRLPGESNWGVVAIDLSAHLGQEILLEWAQQNAGYNLVDCITFGDRLPSPLPRGRTRVVGGAGSIEPFARVELDALRDSAVVEPTSSDSFLAGLDPVSVDEVLLIRQRDRAGNVSQATPVRVVGNALDPFVDQVLTASLHFDQAQACCQQILQARPDHPDALKCLS